jgi:hypothetical protein
VCHLPTEFTPHGRYRYLWTPWLNSFFCLMYDSCSSIRSDVTWRDVTRRREPRQSNREFLQEPAGVGILSCDMETEPIVMPYPFALLREVRHASRESWRGVRACDLGRPHTSIHDVLVTDALSLSRVAIPCLLLAPMLISVYVSFGFPSSVEPRCRCIGASQRYRLIVTQI